VLCCPVVNCRSGQHAPNTPVRHDSDSLYPSHDDERVIYPLCTLSLSIMGCPSDNDQAVDQSNFWTHSSFHWDAHRVGWAIAGGCAALVSHIFYLTDFSYSIIDRSYLSYISFEALSVCQNRDVLFFTSSSHIRRNYTKPAEQRQMYVCNFPLCPISRSSLLPRLRILYMPPVYAVISFFSYRFFRSYTYYSLVETSTLVLSVPISFKTNPCMACAVYEVCYNLSLFKSYPLKVAQGHHNKRILVGSAFSPYSPF
jgi:Organic solute transporter Ostalpha